jgi:hypothetical protein
MVRPTDLASPGVATESIKDGRRGCSDAVKYYNYNSV